MPPHPKLTKNVEIPGTLEHKFGWCQRRGVGWQRVQEAAASPGPLPYFAWPG